MIRTCIGIASVIALAGAASAQHASAPSSSPAQQQSNIVVTGKAKRVCERSIETGSLMPSRVCRTPEQWDEVRQAGLYMLERIRSNRTLAEMQKPE